MHTLNKHQAIVKHSHALAKADKHGTKKKMHALPDPLHTPTLTSEDGNVKTHTISKLSQTHMDKHSLKCTVISHGALSWNAGLAQTKVPIPIMDVTRLTFWLPQ